MAIDQLDRSPAGRKLRDALREACGRLPEVDEVRDGFGHTTFKVRKRSFVIAGMGEDGTSVSVKSDPATQAFLVRHGPWYRTPYIGQHGWVTLDDPLDAEWEDVVEIIEDGWRLAAPKRLRDSLSP
jgi:predicted DNA-binding protein (MmcQ/YjbR family)